MNPSIHNDRLSALEMRRRSFYRLSKKNKYYAHELDKSYLSPTDLVKREAEYREIVKANRI